MTRHLLAVPLALLWLVAVAPVAFADPAGPTNYQTTVVDIAPSVTGFEVNVIGGDSFIQLVAEPDTVVEVVGYGGEPYLRFEGGVVVENDRAPTKYVNQDRYAISEVPNDASVSADPVWIEVSDDGTYSWHDHRAHWMNPDPPPGAAPGDQILEGVIPLVVDGVDVDVTVASVWVPAPSPWPSVIGVVVGVGLGQVGLRRSWTAPVLVGLGVAAASASLAAFFSVPSETAPSVIAWLVPLTAGGLAVWAWRYPAQSHTLLTVASLELVIWGLMRLGWLTAAILPTDLPYWVDRLLTPMVLAGAGQDPGRPGQGASSRTSTSTTWSPPSAN